MIDNTDDLDIMITYNHKQVEITNCFKITETVDKKVILLFINRELYPILNFRSIKSLINEWKVHNAFYRRGWMRKRTKDCGLEFKQNIFLKIGYAILSKLLRE